MSVSGSAGGGGGGSGVSGVSHEAIIRIHFGSRLVWLRIVVADHTPSISASYPAPIVRTADSLDAMAGTHRQNPQASQQVGQGKSIDVNSQPSTPLNLTTDGGKPDRSTPDRVKKGPITKSPSTEESTKRQDVFTAHGCAHGVLHTDLCSDNEYNEQLKIHESVAPHEEVYKDSTKSPPAEAMDCNDWGIQDAACKSQKTQTNGGLDREKVEKPSIEGKVTDPASLRRLQHNAGIKRPGSPDDDGGSGVTGTKKAKKGPAGPG